jgi:hypothetical protein
MLLVVIATATVAILVALSSVTPIRETVKKHKDQISLQQVAALDKSNTRKTNVTATPLSFFLSLF